MRGPVGWRARWTPAQPPLARTGRDRDRGVRRRHQFPRRHERHRALPEEALLDGFAGAALGLECARHGERGRRRRHDMRLAIEWWASRRRRWRAGWSPARMRWSRSRPVSDFAAAATLPGSLRHRALLACDPGALSPGETVLIHAASGGVGSPRSRSPRHAARRSSRPPDRRRNAPFCVLSAPIMSATSRELRFVAAVREATGGAGVDVVLNSLSGEAMEASLELSNRSAASSNWQARLPRKSPACGAVRCGKTFLFRGRCGSAPGAPAGTRQGVARRGRRPRSRPAKSGRSRIAVSPSPRSPTRSA